MFDIVDPFAYKEKLMMPKVKDIVFCSSWMVYVFFQLVCNAADDEFFLPDDTRYWWHQMPQNQLLNRLYIVPSIDPLEYLV